MGKTILIYANELAKSQKLKQELINYVNLSKLSLVQPGQVPDYIITIGGDGTLLHSFHKFQSFLRRSKFLGIHTGHLGFYTDWQPHDLTDLVSSLEADADKPISYPLIEIEIRLQNGQKKTYLALNEIAIRSSRGTMVCDVYIGDYLFETFRGDGLCIATPTGSTGLNKSLGGAVIHPRLDAMQMTEMASLNNRVFRTLSSPIIVPKDEWIELHPQGKDNQFVLTVDHLNLTHLKIKSILARIADERIQFASFKHTHFWNRVEASFIGRNDEGKDCLDK